MILGQEISMCKMTLVLLALFNSFCVGFAKKIGDRS